jgi:LPS export ABC transporter protein LptC
MFKRIISLLFIFLTVVLISLVLSWNYIEETITRDYTLSLKNFILNGGHQIEYKDTDKSGVQFELKAASIKEETDNSLILKDVHFKATLVNGKVIEIQAKNADYMRDKKIAYLTQNVFMKTSDNITLSTEKATLYIEEKYIEGDEDVISTRGDNTQVEAKGFKIDNLEGNITFKGAPTFTYQSKKNKEHEKK